MEFKEPPESTRDKLSAKWQEIAYELRRARGEWAYVGEYSVGVPGYIRSGEYKAFLTPGDSRPPALQMRQDWEVTSRQVNPRNSGLPRRVQVYMRYIGD